MRGLRVVLALVEAATMLGSMPARADHELSIIHARPASAVAGVDLALTATLASSCAPFCSEVGVTLRYRGPGGEPRSLTAATAPFSPAVAVTIVVPGSDIQPSGFSYWFEVVHRRCIFAKDCHDAIGRSPFEGVHELPVKDFAIPTGEDPRGRGCRPGRCGIPSEFDGMCRFFGSGSYERGAGVLPQEITWSARGTGVCSGTLNGEAVSGAVSFEETLADLAGGCFSSHANGHGRLEFLEPAGVVEYRVVHDIGPERRLMGRADGLALGFLTAYVAPPFQSGPAEALAQCAAGELEDFNFEMDFLTMIPLSG